MCPLITPDFSEAANDVTSTPIPDGTYATRITGAELRKSKAGDPMVNWKLTIFGAQGELSKYNNWPVYYSTMQVGKGAGMLKKFYLAATGEVLTGAFDTDMLLSKEVEVDLVNEVNPNTGEPSKYPKVKAVRAITA